MTDQVCQLAQTFCVFWDDFGPGVVSHRLLKCLSFIFQHPNPVSSLNTDRKTNTTWSRGHSTINIWRKGARAGWHTAIPINMPARQCSVNLWSHGRLPEHTRDRSRGVLASMHLDQSDTGQKQAYKEGGQEEAAALSGLASPSGDTVLDRYSNFQHDVPEWGQILLWRPPTCI